MLNISTALFLLNRGRPENSLKGKLLFTEYFLSLKLVEVPWDSKLNILKFPPQFVYNHEKKKIQQHLVLILFPDTPPPKNAVLLQGH